MEYQNDFQSGFTDNPEIMALSNELAGIQAAYSLALEKTEELTDEIKEHEFRLNYFDASMEEGQRLASEVLRGAGLRVENITTTANRVIIPQRKLIARIENEINELSQVLASLTAVAESPAADKSQPAKDNIEILPPFPHKKITTETSVYNMTETAAGPAQKIDEEPAIQLVEEEPPVQMQEQELVAKKPARRMSMLDLVADDSEDFISEEVQPADTLAGTDIISPYQSQSSDHTTTDTLVGADIIRPHQSLSSDHTTTDTVAEAQEPEPPMTAAPVVKSPLPRKIFLRPAGKRNSQPKPVMKNKWPAQNVEDVEAAAVPVEEPSVTPDRLPQKPEAKPEILPEETDKTLLNLEVPLRFSFYDGEVQKQENLRSHEWLVKMLIKIPEDNYEFVRYGKGPQDIKSTLLRYDNGVLNDIYPFDVITPSRPNIAMYFFNCLEDNVSFMKLRLREISIWENQTLLMRINHRNKVLDELLQSGDDILENLRGKL